MNKTIRECRLCGDTSSIDLVAISHDAEWYRSEGLIQSHHVVSKEVHGDNSEEVVSAAVCRRCIGHVFGHLAEHQPVGALQSYCCKDSEEKRKLKAVFVFEGLLAGDGDDPEAVDELLTYLRGRPLEFEVKIV